MKNEISFQQLRAPITMALTVILNSMFTLPSDARLTDLSKVESPIILAAILFAFPLVIWNHPPSLVASGATLLILSLLAHSHRDTYGDFEDTARPLWFTADLLLGTALAFVARKHVRATLSQVSGWRYILHPARLTEALIGIGTILVLFSPQTRYLSRPSILKPPSPRAPCSSGSPRGYSLPCWPLSPRRPRSSAWLPSSGSTASTRTVRSPPPAPFPSCSSWCW